MNTQNQTTQEQVSARVERLPLSKWHVRMMSIAGIAHFSDAFDSLAIAFVLPVLVGLWHIAPTEIGFLISAGYVGQMLGAIAFGWIAEKYGRRTSLRWSVAVISVFSLACAFAWNYTAFLIFRTIQGLGLGGEVPVGATYMNEVAAARFRGRIVLLLQSAFAIGIVITSLVSIWIVPNLGWQWMFYIGALPAILALVLRQIMPESPRWLASKLRLQEADHHHLPRHVPSPGNARASSGKQLISDHLRRTSGLSSTSMLEVSRFRAREKTVESFDIGQVIPPNHSASLAQPPDESA